MWKDFSSFIEADKNISKAFKEKLLSVLCFDCGQQEASYFNTIDGHALCDQCRRPEGKYAAMGQLNINVTKIRKQTGLDRKNFLQNTLKKIEIQLNELIQLETIVKKQLSQIQKNNELQRNYCLQLAERIVEAKSKFIKADEHGQIANYINILFKTKQELNKDAEHIFFPNQIEDYFQNLTHIIATIKDKLILKQQESTFLRKSRMENKVEEKENEKEKEEDKSKDKQKTNYVFNQKGSIKLKRMQQFKKKVNQLKSWQQSKKKVKIQKGGNYLKRTQLSKQLVMFQKESNNLKRKQLFKKLVMNQKGSNNIKRRYLNSKGSIQLKRRQ